MTALRPHPAAELLPRLEGADLAALVEDVRAHGLRVPIVTWTDPRTGEVLLLDGRNRLEACRLAGLEPRFEAYTGDDPVAYGLSCNVARRHLTASQRAMVAAAALPALHAEAKARQGARTDIRASLRGSGKASEKAAALVKVSPRSVEAAAAVLRSGAPELAEAVRSGRAAVSTAAEVARLPRDEQRKLLAAMPEGPILAEARAIHGRRTEARRTERLEKLARLAGTASPLSALGRRYPVVLADPPWRYEQSPDDSRAIENQYPTMALEDICALPVVDVATPDAVLFLWATSPKLEEAMRVLAAWGFTYRTSLVWEKDRLGRGYWARNRHELLLVAVRGNPPCPPPAARPDSIIVAPVGRHSEKPPVVYEIIERAYPGLPKLELFARAARPGWAVWGNEVPPSPPSVACPPVPPPPAAPEPAEGAAP